MTKRILIVTPTPRGTRIGNRITALRWAAMLRRLGHEVRIREAYTGEDVDLLVALHAVKSAPSVLEFSRRRPGAPIVVALTGTDLYGDLESDASSAAALARASRLILLQPAGIARLPARFRDRARVIYQSVSAPRRDPPAEDAFEVCVLGHLRPVKDPLRAALAARLLPSGSRVRIVHIGSALSAEIAAAARAEEAVNPRYRWLGELPRRLAVERLARCRLMALTSESEGGANAISEAVMASVPVVASRIEGTVGLLGDDYPGLFPAGDTAGLAHLMYRAETEPPFLRELADRCHALVPLFDPAEELRRWAALLGELEPALRP